MALLSVRAYARHRAEKGLPGQTHTAVQKAVASGRIRALDGKIDPEDADRLWAQRTDDGHRRNPAFEPSAPNASDGPVPDYHASRARREAAEAGLAELELAQEQEKLLPAEDVESRLVQLFTECKNKLRGVPARARQQDPGLTVEQLALLGLLIDEALVDLAGGR